MDIAEISENTYSDLLINYDSRTPFHEVDWLNNVKTTYKILIKYLGLFDHGEIIAISPIYIKKYGPIRMYGLPLAQAATPSINPLVNAGEELQFLRALDIWIKKNKLHFFQLSWKFHTYPNVKNIDIEVRDNLEIDLSPKMEDIFKNYKSEARTRVRKAVRSGVKVHWALESWVLEEYQKLLSSTYTRQNLQPNFPIEFYNGLYNSMINKNLNIIYATYKGSVIAMLWILHDCNKCYFWDGASDQSNRKLSANHLLHWEISRWAKKQNLKIYDMIGRSVKSGRSGARPGIGRFKKSLGARAVDYYVLYWKSTPVSIAFRIYRWLLKYKNTPES